MLSYRHAFHAGNHADVLKHLILLQIAQYMGEKPAPFWIIDTHAGAGRYALDSVHATKLAEYRDGVGRLWDAKGLPPAALDYLDFIKQFNPDGVLRHYPGSPWLARQVLRECDRPLDRRLGTGVGRGPGVGTDGGRGVGQVKPGLAHGGHWIAVTPAARVDIGDDLAVDQAARIGSLYV